MKRVHVRSPYNYDRDVVSRETGMEDDQETFPDMAVQSEKDNADINVIVRRFGVTGQVPASARLPSYGDYEGVSDFQTAMNVIRAAEEQFMELPAVIRSRFGNSPQAFLEFVSDPTNGEELVKMGLAVKRDGVIIEKEPTGGPPDDKAKSRGKRNVEQRRSSAQRAEGTDKARRRSDEDSEGE